MVIQSLRSTLAPLLWSDRLSPCIDNLAFALHYKVTFLLLLGCSLLITSRQTLGAPIDCLNAANDVKFDTYYDTYCWITSTFTVKEALNKQQPGVPLYPGVDTFTSEKTPIHHKYYQYVWLVLLLQATLFYLPRHLWKKVFEGGRVEALLLLADKNTGSSSSSSSSPLGSPILEAEEQERCIGVVLKYFKTNLGRHNFYFYCCLFCEVLNFANVLLQLHLLNVFLDGAFDAYGLDVILFNHKKNQNGTHTNTTTTTTDPMLAVFPRLAKCTHRKIGKSSSLETVDLLCLLPQNIVNGVIYFALWFWLRLLALISAAVLLYRLLAFSGLARRWIMFFRLSRRCDPLHLEVVLNGCQVGDWFLLHLLAKNMFEPNFNLLIERLSKQLLAAEQQDDQQEPLMQGVGGGEKKDQ